ncbi:ATP-dependent helicase HrpB [hydrothermal vent metagenome]|uniref:ATP-dependent helicase HrpB n=1 Tax=hydrothermal vent metagenome TaxID=652676 RepID=A0A3B1BGN3_9ZZZZ
MSTLPIESVLPKLRAALQRRDEVVLEAPPGAGKTTRVPLALLDADWLSEQKILLLEPRRLAARAAAEYMASVLDEAVGRTVGYRVRLESRVSVHTRIEVVTEGILTRMLQDDPSLEGIGLLIFDEFHERSLDADLGLALALQGRDLFREKPSLKILIMSATLEGERLASLLNDAPVVKSEGRLHSVEIKYGASFIKPERLRAELAPRILATVKQALAEESGSLLVFLPGQAEIRWAHDALNAALAGEKNILITPLFGDLDLAQQRRAIEPAAVGQRKIVLATDIAESSLTIEGVRIIIDCGLHRQAVFDHGAGMSRLHTRRISRASSVQRMGRAGRIEPGVCYRLWSEHQQMQLILFTAAAIEQADLLPLALQLQHWGVDDPAELIWLDPPASGHYATAIQLLHSLGALEAVNHAWKLTSHGQAMVRLPLQPRLAHMLLMAKAKGLSEPACQLAALLSERDPLSLAGADIQPRLSLFTNDSRLDRHLRGRVQRLRTQSHAYRRVIEASVKDKDAQSFDPRWTGYLLACAYPDRIARRRNSGSTEYQMSNGRAVRLREQDPLQQSEWLVIASLGGRQGQTTDQIYLAAEFDPALFEDELSELVIEQDEISWNDKQGSLNAEHQLRLGSLILSCKAMKNIPPEASGGILLEQIRNQGLNLLPWSDELRNWQSRLNLLRTLEDEYTENNSWPDVSDLNLLATLEIWLLPYLNAIRNLKQLGRLDLGSILRNQLSWDKQQQLDQLVPSRLQVPSGSMIRIDYQHTPPVLAVRLQEMFSCTQTPQIANGRIILKLHLLSPARRPIQVTQDLVGFWQSSYREVQKEMKGRYPKHYWPDDPLSAIPSAKTTRKPFRK